jgi:hypothetical protein
MDGCPRNRADDREDDGHARVRNAAAAAVDARAEDDSGEKSHIRQHVVLLAAPR